MIDPIVLILSAVVMVFIALNSDEYYFYVPTFFVGNVRYRIRMRFIKLRIWPKKVTEIFREGTVIRTWLPPGILITTMLDWRK